MTQGPWGPVGDVVTSIVDPVTGGMEITSGADALGAPRLTGEYALRATLGALGVEMFGPGSGVTPTVSAGANCTVNSSGFATDGNGDQVFRVNATGTDTTNNHFEINIPTFDPRSANAATVEFWTDPGQGSALTLYLGTASYALFANEPFSVSAPTQNDPYLHYGLMSFNVNDADWAKSGYAGNNSDQGWVIAKLRVPVTNGQTRQFDLRSIRVGTTRGRGRICVVSDDGYSSWLRMGVPVAEEFGIKTTCAVISDKVGSSSLYGTLAEFQAYVGRGHECVAHGPVGGTGNLIDGLATNALRVADMNTHRDYLFANGLTTARGAQCYVWPQGKYSPTNGDVSLLDAARAAGYTVARAATEKAGNYVQIRALSALAHQRMVMPILGHTYAGATNTADDATETTNINTIVARIQALGLARGDGYLMLHKVVPRGAATSGGIEIEADRLRTLMDAIRDEMDAGRLEAVGMSEFV